MSLTPIFYHKTFQLEELSRCFHVFWQLKVAAKSSQAFFLYLQRFLLFTQQPNLDILNIYFYNSALVQTLRNNKRTHKHRGHKVSLCRADTPLSYGIDLYKWI